VFGGPLGGRGTLGGVPRPPIFICSDAVLERRTTAVSRRLPELCGDAIRIERCPGLRDRRGPVHAASFLRLRKISFDCTAAEFPRIFVHELFHFVWARVGNPMRWRYEDLIRAEIRAGARGELGWSAEWRKAALDARAARHRSRRWREYCCESFCDTAAWLYSGVARHSEFTLVARWRQERARWFEREVGGPLSI
jgi:hypothetical protein